MLDNEPTGADGTAETASTTTSTAKRAAKKATAKKATAAKKTAKKAVKKTTAKKVAAAEPAAAALASADDAPAKKTAKKAAKKATKKAAAKKAVAAETTDAPTSADAGAADSADAAPARKRATRKRATASTTSAATSDAVSTETDTASGPVIPSVLFQPPVADAAPTRRRRAPKAAAADEASDAAVDTAAVAADGPTEDSEDGDASTTRRRRRRGGRGRRGRGTGDAAGTEGTDDAEAVDADGDAASESEADGTDGDDDTEGGATRRRRRRRRKGEAGDDSGQDDPPNTVTRVRTTRSEEPKGIKGSVRIEAKRQRRKEGREAGRRRPPVLTEAEFLARREAVDRVMVVRQAGDRTQIAVLEDGVLVEHHVSRETTGSMIGNVYLGRVQNVLPSMEAAFIDIGRGRNAVLYAGEVNWDAAGLDGQPKRIEMALKSGDSVLVQVTKDPVGNKGSRLTSQISLPGRYLVYVPDGSMTGISRKLPDTERTRLKSILKRVLPENAGVIVRTASEGASEEALSRDVVRLAAQWEDIDSKRATASAPSLLYGEPDLTVRVIRDIFNEDFARLVVSGAEAWDTVNDYVGHVAPDLRDRVERWTSEKDVWAEFRIDEQLAKALDRKVYLPSGGSLVIDRTEAMTVVDVNTGKFTGQGGNLEQTVTENNIEAAEEIVRQLRLRDIGGIIVIDFIDMVLESNRELVLRRLVECLGRDRTKHQVAEVTSLGLVQMTRKRVGQGLLEVFSTSCDSCNGRGLHVHMEPVDDKRRGGDSGSSSGSNSGGKQSGKGRGDKSNDKSADKGSQRRKADDTAPSAEAADGATDADESAALESEGSERSSGRSRRGRRRGGASSAVGETASDELTGTTADAAQAGDSASPAGSDEPSDRGVEPEATVATSEPVIEATAPVDEPEAARRPVLAPRGIDLAPEPTTPPAPKRRRRAATRPAGSPEAGDSTA